VKKRVEKGCTDFEKHEITGFLGKIVLQSDTSANPAFGSKTGPALELGGVHQEGEKERRRWVKTRDYGYDKFEFFG
jgi:hypothetical protein